MRVLILVCLLMSMNQFAEAAIDPYQEAIDQTAHFTVGAVISYGLSFYMPPVSAAFTVIGAAYAREVIQHGSPTDGDGIKRDMLYWTIGAFVGVNLH